MNTQNFFHVFPVREKARDNGWELYKAARYLSWQVYRKRCRYFMQQRPIPPNGTLSPPGASPAYDLGGHVDMEMGGKWYFT